METVEGVAAVDDAIRELGYIQSMHSKLKLEEGLGLSARDFCDFTRTTTQPNESHEQTENRLTRYGQYRGELLQNVAFTSVPPSELILDWIIDDGNAADGRPHRKALFNPNVNFIGIASGPHAVGRVISVIFTHDYKSHDASSSSQTGSHNSGVDHHSTDLSYHQGGSANLPDFNIGALTSIDGGSASLLPVTNLSCDVGQLYLGIRNNGKGAELRRNWVQNGMPKKEIQNFTLPYPVTSATVSATYFPNKNNGELLIRLGKQNANEGGASTLEFEVARFTVLGYPASSSTRVQMQIEQPDDSIVFSPGPASKYTTEFVVILNGNRIEFRSTYSFEEGDTVKIINGKQSVDLPFPPTLDQIDVSGSTLTIWPEKRSTVPDTDVLIRLGS